MTATIKYDRPVKNLIDALSRTGHVTHTAYKKKSVTLHHNGGRLTHEGVLNVWKTRPASAHFDVDREGKVCQYVKVNEYAWAVGNAAGNRETISIEMANSQVGGNWEVSETTWKSAARLAGWLFAKVIGTRPTSSNLHYHKHWASTACAGPYMDSVYDQVLRLAQKSYDYFKAASAAPKPSQPGNAPRKSNTQIAAEVWAGKWGSGDDRKRRLKAAGYNPDVIQALVNRGVGKARAESSSAPARKSVDTIAREVIAGKWGNGDERRRRLAKAGYNPTTIQNRVNQIL